MCSRAGPPRDRYDAILQQNRTHKTLIQSTAKDLAAKKAHEMEVAKPDEEVVLRFAPFLRPPLESHLTAVHHIPRMVVFLIAHPPPFLFSSPVSDPLVCAAHFHSYFSPATLQINLKII